VCLLLQTGTFFQKKKGEKRAKFFQKNGQKTGEIQLFQDYSNKIINSKAIP